MQHARGKYKRLNNNLPMCTHKSMAKSTWNSQLLQTVADHQRVVLRHINLASYSSSWPYFVLYFQQILKENSLYETFGFFLIYDSNHGGGFPLISAFLMWEKHVKQNTNHSLREKPLTWLCLKTMMLNYMRYLRISENYINMLKDLNLHIAIENDGNNINATDILHGWITMAIVSMCKINNEYKQGKKKKNHKEGKHSLQV